MTKDEAKAACEQLRISSPESAWVYGKRKDGDGYQVIECKDEPSYFLEKCVDDDGHEYYREMRELGEVVIKLAPKDEDPDDGIPRA